MPVAARIRQIELNLERWRWLPADLGRRYVVVNVPSFQLTAYDGERAAVTMKVVTGKPDSPTPVLSDDMTTVVFSPYWNVPSTIAEDEIIPAVLRDPRYLGRHNLELVRGERLVGPAALRRGDVQIRQRPGTSNALGLVKFVFPNAFGVYLHDTPDDALFARPRRAFSHGCIRLEQPVALARWVLSDLPRWTPSIFCDRLYPERRRCAAAASARSRCPSRSRSTSPIRPWGWARTGQYSSGPTSTAMTARRCHCCRLRHWTRHPRSP